MARIPTKDLRTAEPLNAFFFAPAMHLSATGASLSTIFSTHPSLERRLAELDKVQRQLSRTGRAKAQRGLSRHPAGPDQAGPAQAG